jgi:hypothetical protein
MATSALGKASRDEGERTVCPSAVRALRRRTVHRRFLLRSRIVIVGRGWGRLGSLLLEEPDADFRKDIRTEEEEADEEQGEGDENPFRDVP